MTIDDAYRVKLMRQAVMEAAGGVGPYRMGAYPLLMECTFRDRVSVDPWDPAAYTERMIVRDYGPTWAGMSEAERAAVRSVLRLRVSEVEAERDLEAAKKRRPPVRGRTWEDM
jgi:hypothetical protein